MEPSTTEVSYTGVSQHIHNELTPMANTMVLIGVVMILVGLIWLCFILNKNNRQWREACDEADLLDSEQSSI